MKMYVLPPFKCTFAHRPWCPPSTSSVVAQMEQPLVIWPQHYRGILHQCMWAIFMPQTSHGALAEWIILWEGTGEFFCRLYQFLCALWFPPFLGGTMVSAALVASSDRMRLELCTQTAHASSTYALEQFPWLKFPYECCITTDQIASNNGEFTRRELQQKIKTLTCPAGRFWSFFFNKNLHGPYWHTFE